VSRASLAALVLDWDMVLQRYDHERRGAPVDPAELPLASRTIDALWRWYTRYSERAHAHGEHASALDRDVDWRLLEEEGLGLWRSVRDELGPSWTVAYHSSRMHETFATPAEYARAAAPE
jgi:hypothetical protein